ncbi:MAG: hypothetical protein PHE51_12090, partial [Eubacteriales bacterium]|nr:hypothetical protein [Eubacteriales bacterium]
RMGNCATIIAQDFLSECAKTLNQLAKEKREIHINQVNDIEPAPSSSALNIKKTIAANIKKQAHKHTFQNNAQLSLFGDEREDEKVKLNNEIFTQIAMRGSVVYESKKRIYEFFTKNTDVKERLSFLKNEYGVCGSSMEVAGYKHAYWEADAKGIGYRIYGDNEEIKNSVTWSEFSKYIQNCIDEGNFYIPETEISKEETTVKPLEYKYGDFINLNGEIYEVLDTNEDEQKTDVGNVKHYVSPHTYIMVEAKSWDEFENAEYANPPENVLPKLEVGTILQYDDSKYEITRIDEDHVHMLDITYRDNLHPQLMASESNFIQLALSSAYQALAASQLDRIYTKGDFENADVRLLSKEYGDKTFNFAYAAIRADRFLMSYSCYEQWTEELVADGKREAYRNYLMDKLECSHKEAMIEADIMTEAEYDSYFSDNYTVNPNDEFSYAGRNYVVLHADKFKKEVMLRDITDENESNLPLYYIRDIPFVYQRTQAIKELQNVELQDFLNGEAEFTDVVYGDAEENVAYTYGYLKVKNAVMYMDYSVEREWSEKDINIGKRRAYRNYLCDVCGYSDKDAFTEAGLMTEDEYDKVTENLIPVSDIPNADEIINAPIEETEERLSEPLQFIAEPEEKTSAPVFKNRIDYIYSADDGIGDGGPKTKFKANIEAIKLLNNIEEENRLATADEQKVLCRYVGWGGLAEAFNEENSSWSDEYTQLKNLLSDSEYKSARASVLCAHYTPPEVIQNIYKAIESFGFKGGNILDPAMGTGLFFAAMPEELKKNSKLYGYELDDVSGRIAKQLTQNADIKIHGYETNEAPDNFFDIAIGNIPFGDYRLHDPKFNKHKFLIHDYFIAKTLDKVRPGGIIAFITSKGTLDKENDNLRSFVGNKADLIGAVRMPNNTFRQMANTEVTADIIFLQKRERIVSEVPYWTKLGNDENGIPVNAYYEENPYMMLGTMQYDNRFGENSLTYLKAPENFDLNESLSSALMSLNAVIPDYERADENEDVETIPADSSVRNFTFTFVDDKLFYRENSLMRKMDFSGKALERIKAMCELRDITRNLIDAQSEESSDEYISRIQSELNSKYDTFVKKNGNISDSANERVFRDDSDYPLICSLEVYDDESKTYSKADMFYKRTIRPTRTIERVDNAVDALKVSLSEKGRVDMDYMCQLYNNPIETVFNELNGQIYINPGKIAEPLPADMNTEEFINTYG